MTHVFHAITWNIPWNSMEFWYRRMKYNLIPWNSMEFGYVAKLIKFHGIPWNFCSLDGDSMDFHGIPWNLVLASSSM